MEQNFIENNIMMLSKQTMDLFLEHKNPDNLISLYMFYYYTAKWQKTNQPKCTTSYAAKGLKKSEGWIRENKKVLIDLGLIEDFKRKGDNGKIEGWYIRLNYIWKNETVKNHTDEKPQCGENHSVENKTPNALNVNKVNALNANNLNASKLSPDSNRLAQLLYHEIMRISNPTIYQNKPPNLKVWSKDIYKLLNTDGVKPELVRKVILFATADKFWKSNILSGGKLRDKFTTLEMQAKKIPVIDIEASAARIEELKKAPKVF